MVENYEGEDIFLEALSASKECPMLISCPNCVFADVRLEHKEEWMIIDYLSIVPPETLKLVVKAHLECLSQRESESFGDCVNGNRRVDDDISEQPIEQMQ